MLFCINVNVHPSPVKAPQNCVQHINNTHVFSEGITHFHLAASVWAQAMWGVFWTCVHVSWPSVAESHAPAPRHTQKTTFSELSKSWTPMWALSAISHPNVSRSDTASTPHHSSKHQQRAIRWELSTTAAPEEFLLLRLFAGLFSIWSVCQRIWNERAAVCAVGGGGWRAGYNGSLWPCEDMIGQLVCFFFFFWGERERVCLCCSTLESILREHWSSFYAPCSQTLSAWEGRALLLPWRLSFSNRLHFLFWFVYFVTSEEEFARKCILVGAHRENDRARKSLFFIEGSHLFPS